jgi:Fe-S-cluster-containing dehydrogenase component
MANKVRLIDVTKCMGCKGCQVACKQWNQLPATEIHLRAVMKIRPILRRKPGAVFCLTSMNRATISSGI